MSDTSTPILPDGASLVSLPADDQYTAFASPSLWDLQRQYFHRQGLDAWSAGQVPHYVTSNPSMANAYAQVALGFWRDLKVNSGTAGQPLYIIELGAGSGRFAYHFLLHFFAAFDAIREPQDRVCYVMTDFSATTVSQWRQRLHTKLAPFVAQGRVDFAVFDAEIDDELKLQHQQITVGPESLTRPPVVIANHVFGSIRQDLFFLDKDRIYEGWLTCKTGAESGAEQPFSELKVDYQRRRITEPGYGNHRWNQLIESYAHRLPPCALLFPSYALGTLSRLSRLEKGNLLLLSADWGTHALERIADQQQPDIDRHGSLSLPVNYHALATLIQAQGGRCWASPAGEGLAILAACWQAPSGSDAEVSPSSWRETAWAANQAFQEFNPNDFYRIKQALETEAQYLSPEQMLAFLRLSHWDTKVFYLMYPYIYDFLAQLSDPSQQAWYNALTEVWRFHLPIGEDYDLSFDLAFLAAELNRWSAAIDWFVQSFEHLNPVQRQGHNLGSIHFNLGIAHWQLAAYRDAEECLLQARKLVRELACSGSHTGFVDEGRDPNSEVKNHPDSRRDSAEDAPTSSRPRSAEVDQGLADLRAWRDRCQESLGAETLRLPVTSPTHAEALFASLLGPHQAQALYRLQRHPDLCRLAGVECLQSTRHAQEWIQKEQGDSKHVLAIIHVDFGLIGVATLEYTVLSLLPGGSRSARFYYWIGQDYQYKGYGPKALSFLHQLADIKGIQYLFSTVDDTNTASRRALTKRGYRRLPFELAGERPGYRYHCFGPSIGESELHSTLTKLLAELGSATTLASLSSERPV